MPILEADLTSTVRSFARAGDINNLSFMDHADRVTHIAFHLGKELGLKEDQFSELILSALLHDIGIVTNMTTYAGRSGTQRRGSLLPQRTSCSNLWTVSPSSKCPGAPITSRRIIYRIHVAVGWI